MPQWLDDFSKLISQSAEAFVCIQILNREAKLSKRQFVVISVIVDTIVAICVQLPVQHNRENSR